MLELILDECEQDPDPVFKIPTFRLRNRERMDRIRNPVVLKANIAAVFAYA